MREDIESVLSYYYKNLKCHGQLLWRL